MADTNGALKRWHLMVTLIILIVGTGFNIGWNMNRVNTIESKTLTLETELEKIKLRQESIIEIKIDINYIKRDIGEIKERIGSRR
jgi:hypothetical protein